MIWRILPLLLKSALMVALFELLGPVADAIGVQFGLVARIAGAISHATALSYREAETLFLFVLATTLLEAARYFWDVITG